MGKSKLDNFSLIIFNIIWENICFNKEVYLNQDYD